MKVKKEPAATKEPVPRVFDKEATFAQRWPIRLKRLRNSYEKQGVLPALYDAVELVRDSEGSNATRWVFDAALEIIADRLTNPKAVSGGGRSANELSKHQTDMLHLDRWKRVEQYLLEHPNSTKKIAFLAVSETLHLPNLKRIKERAVEDLYYHVEKDRKHPDNQWKYHRTRSELIK